MTPPKITRNPNRGKFSAARMDHPTTIRWSRVKRGYMPGKTISARIAGIQEHYARRLATSKYN